MKRPPTLQRSAEIQRVRHGLVRDSYPRLQMLLLVTLTGASGLLASYLLLRAGLVHMSERYPAAFGIAYLVFLALLWLWLHTRAEDYDIPDCSVSSSSDSGACDGGVGGNGGEFGGGGASGSFGAPDADVAPGADSGVVSDGLDLLGSADEAAIPLAALALIAAIIVLALYVVYSAPVLFAELLVDGVLSASLYRRLRGLETRHWLETAVRRTALPFILAAALTSAAGWAMTLHAPHAHSIGEVFHARQT